jgi:microsomal dipeptidase-like Zn-dependent dipeptidase
VTDTTSVPPTAPLAPEAIALHSDAIVIDGHCDSIGDQLERDRPLDQRSDTGHIDLPRLREGGITAQFFAVGSLLRCNSTARLPTPWRDWISYCCWPTGRAISC